jgi:hypothetical protein
VILKGAEGKNREERGCLDKFIDEKEMFLKCIDGKSDRKVYWLKRECLGNMVRKIY